MYKSDNKIKKSLRINPHILEAIEAYRGHTNQDFTAAVETLLIKGLENHDSLIELSKKIDKRLAEMQKQQRVNTDRIVNLIIGIGRIIGRIYGHTRTTLKHETGKGKEEIQELEGHGIKYVLDDLKWRNQEDRHV